MIPAVIDVKQTAPAAMSFAIPPSFVKLFLKTESTVYSIAELNNSALKTPAMQITTMQNSTPLNLSKKANIIAKMPTTICLDRFLSDFNANLIPWIAQPKLLRKYF